MPSYFLEDINVRQLDHYVRLVLYKKTVSISTQLWNLNSKKILSSKTLLAFPGPVIG
jgi:hypothetical protein